MSEPIRKSEGLSFEQFRERVEKVLGTRDIDWDDVDQDDLKERWEGDQTIKFAADAIEEQVIDEDLDVDEDYDDPDDDEEY